MTLKELIEALYTLIPQSFKPVSRLKGKNHSQLQYKKTSRKFRPIIYLTSQRQRTIPNPKSVSNLQNNSQCNLRVFENRIDCNRKISSRRTEIGACERHEEESNPSRSTTMFRRRRLKSSRGNRMRCRGGAIDPGTRKPDNRKRRIGRLGNYRIPGGYVAVSDTQAGYATNIAFDRNARFPISRI